MRRFRCVWLTLSALIAFASDGPVAQAQSGSVKALFEKYNLLGTFAWDCSKPASRDSLYFVNRLLDAEHVQRDQMEGPTTRSLFSVLDQASETGRGEVRVSGQITGVIAGKTVDGQPVESIWRIEQGRMVQLEARVAGQTLIAGGRWVSTGRDMPWLNRCDAR